MQYNKRKMRILGRNKKKLHTFDTQQNYKVFQNRSIFLITTKNLQICISTERLYVVDYLRSIHPETEKT